MRFEQHQAQQRYLSRVDRFQTEANDNDRPFLEVIRDYQLIGHDDENDEPEEPRDPWPGIVGFAVVLCLGLAAVLAQVLASN